MAKVRLEPDPDRREVPRTGAVESVQRAEVDVPRSLIGELWRRKNLERLARAYWRYLSRISLGLFRVVYEPDARTVVLGWRRLALLRFHAPEYEIADGRGIVRWRIRDGVLVAKRDQGYLEIDVRRNEAPQPGYAQAHVEVEVANFYPAIATWIARWFYKMTQSRIHVLVTHGFLRSLARRELEASAVGRFETSEERAPVNIGETPWPVVGALVAAFVGAVALLWRVIRSGR